MHILRSLILDVGHTHHGAGLSLLTWQKGGFKGIVYSIGQESLQEGGLRMKLWHHKLVKENNTNSGDKHCIPTHCLYDLKFRMLVNIHFQKWPLQFLKAIYIYHNSTLAKQNEDSMTGKPNISRPSLKVTIYQPLLIMWKPLVST